MKPSWPRKASSRRPSLIERAVVSRGRPEAQSARTVGSQARSQPGSVRDAWVEEDERVREHSLWGTSRLAAGEQDPTNVAQVEELGGRGEHEVLPSWPPPLKECLFSC